MMLRVAITSASTVTKHIYRTLLSTLTSSRSIQSHKTENNAPHLPAEEAVEGLERTHTLDKTLRVRNISMFPKEKAGPLMR